MLNQVRSVDFGSTRGGLSTVSYSLYDSSNVLVSGPNTAGVSEVGFNTGVYACNISFPDGFHGTIIWSSGEMIPVYAAEQYNVEENNPVVDQIYSTVVATAADLAFVKDIEGGRWKIDPVTSTMTFYKDDNTTVVATFQLKDQNGQPTFNAPFERSRLP